VRRWMAKSAAVLVGLVIRTCAHENMIPLLLLLAYTSHAVAQTTQAPSPEPAPAPAPAPAPWGDSDSNLLEFTVIHR